MTKSVKLSDIRIDGGTQARASLDEATVADYAEAIADGAEFPPVTVFFDGSAYWLADGFHRFHAHRKAKVAEIAADVRHGTVRDATLHSLSANSDHGLRRSNADKRKAVETMLGDVEWSGWSDREIARQCRVSQPLVSSMRPKVTDNSISERTYTTKHGTTAQMDTSKIGKPDAPIEGGAEKKEIAPEPVAPQGPEGGAEPVSAEKEITSDDEDEDERDALISELKEAVAALEKENAALKAENKKFAELKMQYDRGGFEQIIKNKDEVIHAQATRIERESTDKVSYMRSSDMWKKRAEEAGWSGDIVIPIPGRAANG